jgi:hypothetical protein
VSCGTMSHLEAEGKADSLRSLKEVSAGLEGRAVGGGHA